MSDDLLNNFPSVKKAKRAAAKSRKSAKKDTPKETQTPVEKPTRVQVDDEGITAQQDLFCREYVRLRCNGTKAAIAAGYAEDSAGVAAARLLAIDKIQRRVWKYKNAITEEIDISVKRILNEYGIIAFANLTDYTEVDDDGNPRIDFTKVTRAQMAAVSEIITEERTIKVRGGDDDERETVVKTRFKMHDKVKALEALADINKLFVKQLALQNPDGTPLAPPVVNVGFIDPKAEKKD